MGSPVLREKEYREGSRFVKQKIVHFNDFLQGSVMTEFLDRLESVIFPPDAKRHGRLAAFSSKTGINEGTIRGWLRGTQPSADQLARLAKSGISVDWLLTGENGKRPTMCQNCERLKRFIDQIAEVCEKARE